MLIHGSVITKFRHAHHRTKGGAAEDLGPFGGSLNLCMHLEAGLHIIRRTSGGIGARFFFRPGFGFFRKIRIPHWVGF